MKVIKDISSNIKQRCKETIDQLRSVSSQLENFKRRINLIDQDKGQLTFSLTLISYHTILFQSTKTV